MTRLSLGNRDDLWFESHFFLWRYYWFLIHLRLFCLSSILLACWIVLIFFYMNCWWLLSGWLLIFSCGTRDGTGLLFNNWRVMLVLFLLYFLAWLRLLLLFSFAFRSHNAHFIDFWSIIHCFIFIFHHHLSLSDHVLITVLATFTSTKSSTWNSTLVTFTVFLQTPTLFTMTTFRMKPFFLNFRFKGIGVSFNNSFHS